MSGLVKICPDCNGSGKNQYGGTCNKCQGSGNVPAE